MTTPTQTPSDPNKLAEDAQTILDNVAAATTIIAKANLWTAIIGFFTALPGIINLIQNFMGWVNAISGNNPQAFISDLGQAFSQLSAAKTPEDRTNAAKNISSLISKLPS